MLKKGTSKKIQTLVQLILFVGILAFINILANARIGGRALYYQFDLTEEKRYTLTEPTRELLQGLEDVAYIRVLLEGEFPAGFKRLQSATQDLLDDFRAISGNIEYEFENPNEGTTEQINARREQLKKDGIVPVNLRVEDAEGVAKRQIYPFAIIYFKNRTTVVNLLENEVPGVPPEVVLNNSVGLLEYKFANALQKMQVLRKPNILLTTGHGELLPVQTADLEKSLREFYEVGRIDLDSIVNIGQECAALVVAKPRAPFSEKDKFKIDQYVMNGGKVLWLIDKVRVDLDSLRGRQNYFPVEYDVNLDDLLFEYGIRIQPNLVLDMQCSTIPQVTGMVGNEPQFDFMRYPYHPVVAPVSDNPVVKSLGVVNLFYPSAIDTTVKTKTDIRKSVLLQSSEKSRVQYLPLDMNFEFLRYGLDADKFDMGPQVLSLLLEGSFPSLFENRVTESMLSGLNQLGIEFKTRSTPTKMIVVSDGDVARNNVNWARQSYSPLGYNEFDRYLFANKDFVINALEYLIDSGGVIEARGKEVKLRLLDGARAREEKGYWQAFNILAPLAFLLLFGLAYNWWRHRRYSRA